MPTKQIAIYADADQLGALTRLAFGHGWPQRVLLPIVHAATKFYSDNNITSYDPDNERKFTDHLRSALAGCADKCATGKAKRGRNVTRPAAGTSADLQNPDHQPNSPVGKAVRRRKNEQKGTDEKRQGEEVVG